MRAVGAKSKDIKPRVMEVLSKVKIADKYNKYPDELSGGELQRVAIARAIAYFIYFIFCHRYKLICI